MIGIRSLFTTLTILLGFLLSVHGQEERLATLTVNSGSYVRDKSVTSASLEGLILGLETADLQLREIVEGRLVDVPSQVEYGTETRLWWVLEDKMLAHEVRVYELWKVPKKRAGQQMQVVDSGSAVTVKSQGKEVLSYQYAKPDMPAGVSSVYSRAGYIHPLWSPAGQVLTRIQPPDHYHHYGIWNPWTHTEFEGNEVDFWNLGKEQGTVEVSGSPARFAGDVFAEIRAVHQHVVLADSTRVESKVALDETLTYKIWNVDPQNEMYVVDVISALSCASESPLTLKEYRYQGFGYRAVADWNDKNTVLLTSEGFNKEDGNATRARWIDVRGPSVGGTSGILFMTNPSNFNFPELLRIWPTGTNKGTENVFVNFNPTQDRDWVIEPNRSYALKYRMVIYDGELMADRAEQIWNDYAHPPTVTIAKEHSLKGKKILVFTKNGEGYVHDNIASSVEALQKLGRENGFSVEASDDPSVFVQARLSDYDAIVFSNTNNKTFDTEAQKIGFQKYVRNGGGFVGIHIASGSERDWPWYWKLIGGKFLRHPKLQKFEIEVIDRDHPSTNFLPEKWIREDECYFLHKMNPSNHILLAARLPEIVDEKKKDYPGDTWADLSPLAWCHEFDGGRQWYTALGHKNEHYSDPTFMRHILGGLEWVIAKD